MSKKEVKLVNFITNNINTPHIILNKMITNHADIFNGIQLKDLDIDSFINFSRYYPYLIKYFNNNYYINIKININGILTLILESKVGACISLSLTFLNTGIVNFLSLDKDFVREDNQTYVFSGEFCVSNNLGKGVKIKRLLAIFECI